MKRLNLVALLVIPLAIVLFAAVSPAVDGKVTIIKPEVGEVVTGPGYMVEFMMDKGTYGDHLHLFLDGTHLGPITKKSRFKLTQLESGPHTVTLKLADRKHKFLGPEGTADFTVE